MCLVCRWFLETCSDSCPSLSLFSWRLLPVSQKLLFYSFWQRIFRMILFINEKTRSKTKLYYSISWVVLIKTLYLNTRKFSTSFWAFIHDTSSSANSLPRSLSEYEKYSNPVPRYASHHLQLGENYDRYRRVRLLCEHSSALIFWRCKSFIFAFSGLQDIYSNPYAIITVALFVFYILFAYVLLINLLIAMMGDTYSKIANEGTQIWKKQVSLCLWNFLNLHPPAF